MVSTSTLHMAQRVRRKISTMLAGDALPALFDPAYYCRVNQLDGFAAKNPFLHFLAKGRKQGLSHHPLFDVAYYRSQNPDVDFGRISPVDHFLEEGWRRGKNPNPLFDVNEYLRRYPDVGQSGINPLVHYCVAGMAEGRVSNILWDDEYIARQRPGGMTLAEYLTDTGTWSVNPHPMFDAAFYRQQAKQHGIEITIAPMAHFFADGARLGMNPHPLFNLAWYLDQYGDVATSSVNPLAHYVMTGEAENRQPHPFFDGHWYRRHLQLKGVKADRNLPAHFLSPEGLRIFPHPMWDQRYVNEQAPEAGIGLMRYLRDSRLWHINPHPLFDGAFYRRRASHRLPVPDNMSPAEHFLAYGCQKAIDPHPLFDVDWYVLRFKKLYKTRRNPLAHYIMFAGKSRRRPHPLWNQGHVNTQLPDSKQPVVLQDYLQDSQWWFLQPHPLFDVAYYQQQLADLSIDPGMSPLEHYMREGCTLGLSPNRLFDPQWYRQQYAAELKAFDGNAFTHFIEEGEFNGCNPHPCVDIDWYRKRLRDQGMPDEGKYLIHYFSGDLPHAPLHPLWDQQHVDAQVGDRSVQLHDYLHDRQCWGLQPHPLFDPQRVCEQAASAGLSFSGAPLDAFLRSDYSARLSTHVLFDPVWYLRHYPDVAELGRSPLLHYVSKGQYEGRNPHVLWDQGFVDRQAGEGESPVMPVDYLKSEALQQSIQPHPLWDGEWIASRHARPPRFLEYLRDPANWGLNTHPVFDAGYYRFQVEKCGGQIDRPALQHFLETGWKQGCNPHRLFDVDWYLWSYSDVQEMGLNPLLHYLSPGENKIRDPHPLFDCTHYCQSLEQRGISVPQNLLVYYLAHEEDVRTSPHPLWDVDFIESQLGDVVSLQQYLKDRKLWAINPHPLFDVAYYQRQVGKTDIAPLLHYVHERNDQVNPSYYFHTQWYVGRNQYLEGFTGKTRIPLVHFLLKGTRQGESPHPFFDAKWYADRHMQADRVGLSPILHYLGGGWQTGLNPNPMFNAAEYRKRHAIADNEEPLKWYLRHNRVTLPATRNRFIDAFVCQPVPARPAGGDAKPAPAVRYLVFFTPRSGSSLLTDLMSSTGVLGKPGEWFNHDLVSRARNTLPGGASTPEEFVQKIQRYRVSDNGVFGAQLVWPHLENIIEAGCESSLVDRDEAIIVHLRQNIVAQAISLYLASESGYFHSSQANNARYLPSYSAEGIRSQLGKLLEQECNLSAYLQKHRSDRLRFSFYEELAENPQQTVNALGKFVGVECSSADIHSPRKKIATGINREFEERFRAEHADELLRLLGERRSYWQSGATMPLSMFS